MFDEVEQLLKELRKSLLVDAYRGNLTAKWRADHPAVEPAHAHIRQARLVQPQKEGPQRPKKHAAGRQTGDSLKENVAEHFSIHASELPTLPSTWCWVRVDELADVQLGQRRAPEFARLKKYLYLRAGNITWNGIDFKDVKSMGFRSPKSLFLKKGDVLLNEASGTKSEVGKPAIWNDEIPNCCFQATVLRLRSKSAFLRPEWIFYNRLLGALRAEYAEMTPGLGIIHLTAKLMRGWPIPIAPAEEQDQVIKVISEALSRVSSLNATLVDAKSAMLQLAISVVTKALQGSLLSQDPNDEPASAILERIRRTQSRHQHARSSTHALKTRPAMKHNAQDTLTEWLRNADVTSFTFADLFRDLVMDYDDLKAAVFRLLDETTVIEQVFDEASGTIRFRRLTR